MISYRALRGMFDGHLTEAHGAGRSHASGRLAALREFHDLLGLDTDPRTGRPGVPLDERGLPELRQGRARPNEFSLRTIAEAIMGHEFTGEFFHPSGGYDWSGGALQEAAIDPTAFQNINTFNRAVAGLVTAEIMDRFMQPDFFGRDLVTIKPTRMNGQKIIGVARMTSVSSAAKGRLPGEQHAEIGTSEAWQTTPETVEKALKCRVTREAVFYDLTDQVLEEAGEVGHELGYGMEKDIADCVEGTTSSYNRNGTSYSTYQSSSPWINNQSNGIASGSFDYTNVDKARQLFVGMTDPESGKEIKVYGKDILVMPANELLMRQQVYGTALQLGTQLNSNFPSAWTKGGNPLEQATRPYDGQFSIRNVGPIWYNRATASDGLNLSASNAKQYWWIGDFARAFWWMENWPLTPWQAMADELAMKDQGLVAVYGCNYRGVAYVREPRYVVRNTN